MDVLDEPSIGLHPDNINGLLHVFHELVEQGNSLVVVDHNIDIIRAADWVVEIGPGSGAEGGRVIDQGTPAELKKKTASLIGPFLNGKAQIKVRQTTSEKAASETSFTVSNYFNLKNVTAIIPTNQITAVTGFSSAGKTSLILDSLVPALKAQEKGDSLPKQIDKLNTPIKSVVSVDAVPVGKSTRSTVATYTSIMDNLRRLFAAQPAAKEKHWTASYFSYNNKQGACSNCGGTGIVTLDIQYLPDMQQICPVCNGDRYNKEIQQIKWHDYSIVDLLNLDVRHAIPIFKDVPKIQRELKLLDEVGLGYLHLGESTPTLSGGEAQRLKLVKHLNRQQKTTLFVFDEPSVGLHPLDVQVLLQVMQRLIDRGATIIIITHDINLMVNADYLIDLGPRGGKNGGQIVAQGHPADLIRNPKSLTTQYLAEFVGRFQN